MDDKRDWQNDRQGAAIWATELLARPVGEVLLLDTETTDLDGEIIELAILDTAGELRYSRRFRPRGEIAAGAARVHGLTAEMLAGEPTWADEWPAIASVLGQAQVLLIYNARFDVARIWHTCAIHGCSSPEILPPARCLMHVYARFVGEWDSRHSSYRWQRLPGAGHSAADDCRAALAVLKKMAQPVEAELAKESGELA
jgi:DNA polymerase-3 subunit epsilon